ncbi:temptin, partial [Elysia marginata]
MLIMGQRGRVVSASDLTSGGLGNVDVDDDDDDSDDDDDDDDDDYDDDDDDDGDHYGDDDKEDDDDEDDVTWHGVGHLNPDGGGALNPFGVDWIVECRKWTQALCEKDSDGDGLTNGQELGDPDCVWTIGTTPARSTDLTHP